MSAPRFADLPEAVRRLDGQLVEVESHFGLLALALHVNLYHNGRLCLSAADRETREPWGVASVNLPDEPCPADCFWAKEWSEGEAWVPQLIAAYPGLFERTGRLAASGFVTAELIRVKGPAGPRPSQ